MKKEEKTEFMITYLLRHKDTWTSGQALSNYLQISMRQLRNYIKELNAQYAAIILSSEHGYMLNFKQFDQLTNYPDVVDYVEVRRMNILNRLIYAQQKTNIFDLEDFYHVSVPTIEADLVYLKKYIKPFMVYLKRNQNHIFLTGKESNLRFLLCKIYHSQMHKKFNKDIEIFHKQCICVSEILRAHSLYMENHMIEQLSAYIIITKSRESLFPIEQIHFDHKESIMVPVSNALIQTEQHHEIHFIAQWLFHLIHPDELDAQTVKTLAIHYKKLCMEFSLRFSYEQLKCLSNWYQKQKDHVLKSIMITCRNLKIQYSYPFANLLAKRFMQYIDVDIPEAELYELILIFQTFTSSYEEPFTATYVYQGDLNLIVKNIKRIHQQFRDVMKITERKSWFLYSADQDKNDIILTDMDLSFKKTYISLHPILTQNDIMMIQKTIKSQMKKRKYSFLSDWIRDLLKHGNIKNITKETDFYSSYEFLVEIYNEKIQLYYTHTIAKNSFLDIYISKNTTYFIIGISKNDTCFMPIYFHDLYTFLCENTYQKILLPISQSIDVYQRFLNILDIYVNEC